MKLDWPLIIEYRQDIQSIVCHSIYSEQDREDMEQDVMVWLVKGNYEYDPEKCSSIKRWLMIRVWRTVRDILRVRTHSRSQKWAKAWKNINEPWCLEGPGDGDFSPCFDPAAPERDTDLELVNSYLSKLSENLRAYAVLRFKGATRDIAVMASGVRWSEYREFTKLIRASA